MGIYCPNHANSKRLFDNFLYIIPCAVHDISSPRLRLSKEHLVVSSRLVVAAAGCRSNEEGRGRNIGEFRVEST
jgi:hypothetical protein